jgi:CheY-like chemotaxis protein
MRKNKILVIDDNLNATRIVKLSLERTGSFEVKELNDPAQGLAVAREFQPDLILLDVCMPDIEGSEVAVKITSDPDFAATPVVFLTSIVTPREAGKTGSITVGRHEYIAKPARTQTIVACVQKHLAQSGRLSPSAEYAPRS